MYHQYSDAYSKDDEKYVYHSDTGETITVVAGENGVTKEWIAQLRQQHRIELNNEYKHRHYKRTPEGRVRGNISLESITYADDEEVDTFDDLIDFDADPLLKLTRCEEGISIKERFESVWGKLTDEQRELVVRIKINGESQRKIAAEMGVTPGAINHQIIRIEKKFKKIFLKGVYFGFQCH